MGLSGRTVSIGATTVGTHRLGPTPTWETSRALIRCSWQIAQEESGAGDDPRAGEDTAVTPAAMKSPPV